MQLFLFCTADIEATAVLQGERVVREGKVYFQCVDFFVDFVIGHCSVHLTNLFNGDKELGEYSVVGTRDVHVSKVNYNEANLVLSYLKVTVEST